MELEKTSTLLEQVTDIVSQPPLEQENWLKEVGKILTGWCELENYAVMAQCKTLYTIWSVWEAKNNQYGVFLSNEVTGLWGGDFYKWAKAYSRSNTKEPHETTISNKIGVYRDWIAEGIIEYPQYIEIPITNELGLETGQVERVEFNPMECNYSKLLLCKNKARNNELKQDDYNNLANPKISTRKFEFELKNANNNDNVDTFSTFEKDGIIYGYENGEMVAALQILYENEHSKPGLFKRTVRHILNSSGMREEASKII